MSKMREDELERRRAHNARIIDEYQVFDYRPVASAEAAVVANVVPIKPAYELTLFDCLNLGIFVGKLESTPEQVSPELLQQTHDWTPAYFTFLAEKWPDALAHLAMAFRDQAIKISASRDQAIKLSAPKLSEPQRHVLKLKAPLPPHDIVFAGNRAVIVEKVKRRVRAPWY